MAVGPGSSPDLLLYISFFSLDNVCYYYQKFATTLGCHWSLVNLTALCERKSSSKVERKNSKEGSSMNLEADVNVCLFHSMLQSWKRSRMIQNTRSAWEVWWNMEEWYRYHAMKMYEVDDLYSLQIIEHWTNCVTSIIVFKNGLSQGLTYWLRQ